MPGFIFGVCVFARGEERRQVHRAEGGSPLDLGGANTSFFGSQSDSSIGVLFSLVRLKVKGTSLDGFYSI